MKRAFLTLCSVCLILAGVFGLFTGVNGIQDAQNLQEYKTEDSEDGLAAIDVLLDGIAQLRENEDTYQDGVETYEAGLISYQQGQAQVASGAAQLAENRPKLTAGQQAYDEGLATLEAGKREYAEGKAKIEANTESYNAGKEQLAKIEPLLPYLNQYVAFRDGTIAKLPGFDTAQAWFVAVVRPIAAQMGLSIPTDVTDFPAYINQMVADGQAQLKEYEDGVAQLAEAEKTIAAGEAALAAAKQELDAGYASYAAGEQALAAGKSELAQGAQDLEDGKLQLSEFESGAAQIAAGLEALLAGEENVTGSYRKNEGKGDEIACPSVRDIVEERLGEDFSYWKLDENGEILVLNGCQYLDLDVCEAIAFAAQDYINVYQGDPDINGETFERIFHYIFHPNGTYTRYNLTHELTYPCSQGETVIREVIARYVTAVLCLLTSVLCILSGVFGLVFAINGRHLLGAAHVLGYVTAGFAIVTNLFGIGTHWAGYIYPVALYEGEKRVGYEFSSHTLATSMILALVVAVLFVVIVSVVRAAKRKAEQEARLLAEAEAVASAATGE